MTNIDLASEEFWAQAPDVRHAAFKELRQREQAVFVTEKPATRKHPAKGYYAIVRYDDVAEVSKNAKVFSSEPGVTTPEPKKIVSWVFGDSMVNMDNPKHGRLRSIVQRAFSPKNLAKVELDIDVVAKRAVDDLIAHKPDDYIHSVAAQVPFQVLSNMMGIPHKHRSMILSRIQETTERARAAHALSNLRLPGKGTLAMAQLHLLVARVARDYKRHPGDDIMSALVNTEIDGHHLGYRDLGSFFNLLLVAGIETTRNEIVQMMWLLTKHRDQRALLHEDFEKYIAGAIEEVIRYEPSIFQFRRNVTQEYEIAGRKLVPGDKVAIFFNSANRDESVFPDADKFDITRDPNPHIGFGAGGPHTCLGKLLARREITALYRELFERVPGIHVTKTPEVMPSNFDNRFKKVEFALS